VFTLNGVQPVRRRSPSSHVSFYEARLMRRGRQTPSDRIRMGRRAAESQPSREFPRSDCARIQDRAADDGIAQLYGDAWEWTRSSYEPYPGFRPFEAPAAEYNGKFMCGQMVLRGGSAVRPRKAISARPTGISSRPRPAGNFSGIRLAEDA
jgi:formylglycine-generating enzyme required for sulfatase activity